MDNLIYEYLILVRDLKIDERDLLTKYLYLFTSKAKNNKFLEYILKIFIKIMKDNRVNELKTDIIEYVNSYNLDDYDTAFLLNIIFYPNDYLNEYHDDYYFDLYKYCYIHVGNKVTSTHPFVKMCEVFHKYLKVCMNQEDEINNFLRSIMIIVICDYWLNQDKYTLEKIESVFSRLCDNIIYYHDVFYMNGFTKFSLDDKNLAIFINKLFFTKGEENHEPIRR